MPRPTSNLTNAELRRIFGHDENSPLYEHIKQISNNYLSSFQRERTWGNISNGIKRQIILIWKVFFDKYGSNRGDMNEIKERSQTNNYNLPLGLTRSYGVDGALESELLRWNTEECNTLMDILEHEESILEDGEARIKKRRKHKSKKKSSKKKKKKKKKSKKR